MFVNQNILDERNFNNRNNQASPSNMIRKLMTMTNSRPQPDSERMFCHDIDEAELRRNPTGRIRRKTLIKKHFQEVYSKVKGNKLLSETKQEEQTEIAFYTKFYQFECLNFLYSLLTIISSVVHYELTYQESNEKILNKYAILLYFTTIASILLWLNLIFYEMTKLEYNKRFGYVTERDNIFTTSQYIQLIFIFIYLLLHPNPIFKDTTYLSYNNRINKDIERSVNSVLTIFVLFRAYFIFRFIIFLTNWMNPSTDNICRKFSFRTNIFFSIKSLLQGLPFLIYLVIGFISVFIICFSIRAFERELSEYFPSQNYNNIFNTVWYVLNTMTTVGYGDFTVRTSEARIIAMVACIFGSFLISLLLLTLTNFLNHTKNELTLFRILERIELNENNSQKAKKVIGNFCSSVKLRFKNNKSNESDCSPNSMYASHSTNYTNELKNSISEYKNSCNDLENNDSQHSAGHPFYSLYSGITLLEKEYKKIIDTDKKNNSELQILKDKLETIYFAFN